MIRASRLSSFPGSNSAQLIQRRTSTCAKWFAPLQQWGVSLLRMLAAPSEVRIQKINRDGSTYWRVYDPASGRSASLASEQEVRIWLEQRYNG
ncbi:MAG TPA: hypothetical protein V6D10_25155 [Trichocoleus sp.]|jgi:hypothetical protein